MTLEIQPRVLCQKPAWIYLKIRNRCWIWTCLPKATPFPAGRGTPWWQAACPGSSGGRPRQKPASNHSNMWTWGSSVPGPLPTPALSLQADVLYGFVCSLKDCIEGSLGRQANPLLWLELLREKEETCTNYLEHSGSHRVHILSGRNRTGLLTLALDQGPSHLCPYGLDNSAGGPCPVPCKMFSRVPGLHPQDASSTSPPKPQVVLIKNVPRHCQMSFMGQKSPLVKNNWNRITFPSFKKLS